MPHIEGPFNPKPLSAFLRDEEEIRQAKRKAQFARYLAFDAFDYASVGVGGGHGGGGGTDSSDGYIDDLGNLTMFDDLQNRIVGDDNGVYFSGL